MKHWDKYACVVLDEDWPREFSAILEPACIALGAFTSGDHFNVNYFDYAGFFPKITRLEVVHFWLELCLESLALEDVTLAIVRLPAKRDFAEWHRRFGHIFNCDISGATIAEIAYSGPTGHPDITEFLPRPHKDGYGGGTGPSKVFSDIARQTRGNRPAPKPVPTRKPADHCPQMLQSKRTNITDYSGLSATRASFSAEELKQIAKLPSSQQPSEVRKQNARTLTSGRRAAQEAAMAQHKRKREQEQEQEHEQEQEQEN